MREGMPFVSGNLGDGLSWVGEGDATGGVIDLVWGGQLASPAREKRPRARHPGTKKAPTSEKKTLYVEPVSN